MMISVGSIMAFLPLYGQDRGFSNIGLFFTVYAIALILARFMTGRLADEHGSNVVFIPSLLLAITRRCCWHLPAAKQSCCWPQLSMEQVRAWHSPS